MESFAGADLHKRVTQLAVLRWAAAVTVSFPQRSEDHSGGFKETPQRDRK